MSARRVRSSRSRPASPWRRLEGDKPRVLVRPGHDHRPRARYQRASRARPAMKGYIRTRSAMPSCAAMRRTCGSIGPHPTSLSCQGSAERAAARTELDHALLAAEAADVEDVGVQRMQVVARPANRRDDMVLIRPLVCAQAAFASRYAPTAPLVPRATAPRLPRADARRAQRVPADGARRGCEALPRLGERHSRAIDGPVASLDGRVRVIGEHAVDTEREELLEIGDRIAPGCGVGHDAARAAGTCSRCGTCMGARRGPPRGRRRRMTSAPARRRSARAARCSPSTARHRRRSARRRPGRRAWRARRTCGDRRPGAASGRRAAARAGLIRRSRREVADLEGLDEDRRAPSSAGGAASGECQADA